MTGDRAEDIAREIAERMFAAMHEATGWCGDVIDEHYAVTVPIIAAALRSYADRRLESAAERHDKMSSRHRQCVKEAFESLAPNEDVGCAHDQMADLHAQWARDIRSLKST